MNIVFYRAPMSSAIPVASVLTELQVPHERITFDLEAGDQRKPAFLKLNPNGKVPTLLVDGQPLFEALAILQWLADHFGVAQKLWPADGDPTRLAALSWSTWNYVTLGGTLSRLLTASSPTVPPELHHPPLAEAAKQQVLELFGLLDDRLSQQPFMLGQSFSLLDIIVGSTVLWAQVCGVPLNGHPALNAYAEQCKARPSIRDEWQ
ncbi:MAG: glutathione S-transferase family protein [Myxococcales bacterium]|nr:glutathione S-transferase family protein [Myxococcales bacterium]